MVFLEELLKIEYIPYIILVVAAAVVSLGFTIYLIIKIRALPEGTPKMKEIADYIREGSNAYLKRQFRTIIIIGVIIAIFLALIVDLNHWLIGEFSIIFVSFLIGMGCSIVSAYIAMYTATIANVRTANKVREEGVSKAIQVAFDGGMVMGLSVVGLSLASLITMYLVLAGIVMDANAIEGSIIGLAFGASFAALFGLLGGGIYTKAADVGADLVGKVEAGIPEDDPRNPGVIADNVGDNVGDIAGRGADLFESSTGETIASMVLAVILFQVAPAPYKIYAMFFPLVVRSWGLFASIIGKYFVKGTDEEEPWSILTKGLNVTTIAATGFLLLTCILMFEGIAALFFFVAAAIGLFSSLLVGIVTLYYTDERYRPVKSISEASKSGPATAIITGLSYGMESTGLPVIIFVGVLLGSFFFGFIGGQALVNTGNYIGFTAFDGGIFATSLATMGMLSISGIVLGLDGYGPIVDNAGGIVEMADLEKEVRNKTDKLDACGNTTKAYTKGYAVAAMALAAVLLFEAFSQLVNRIAGEGINFIGSMMFIRNLLDLENVLKPEAFIATLIIFLPLIEGTISGSGGFEFFEGIQFSLSEPEVIIGLLLGALIVFIFTGFAMRAVGDTAQDMITEIRRQFRDIPGLKEGKEGVKPEYARCVDIATKSSLKHMVLPGTLIIVVPIIVGFLLGAEGVGGLLVGSITTGICMALFLNTGGGAFDNSKKLSKKHVDKSKPETVESYHAAIQGDILGDPMKDTAGPSLNVVVKLMATISLQLVSLFVLYHLI